jgi:hypothetical protein
MPFYTSTKLDMSRPSERVADLFEKKRPQMKRAFKKTGLAARS